MYEPIDGFHLAFLKDMEFMRPYVRLADMVADLIGPHCEMAAFKTSLGE